MKLMVLDGNSIINRAFYGIRLLSTRDGLYTNAIYGFLNILQKLVAEDAPDALCVTFDRKAPTFRHEAFAAYKANRHGMPEELAVQMPVLKEVLDAMSIPRYELDGWEADDLIGTIARICEGKNWDCEIVTGDRDSLQLITAHTHVKLVSTRMGQTTYREMTPETFREDYGFDPIHMIDLKGLMGDSSDNIPGVKGVGEKTAMSLVQTYGTVRALYDALEKAELKPAVRRKLTEGREMAFLSYDLAAIHCDVPITFAPEDALRRPVKEKELYDLFLRLEFQKLIEKFDLSPREDTPAPARPELHPERVTDAGRLEKLLEQWEEADRAAVLALPDLSGVSVSTAASDALVFQRDIGESAYAQMLSVLFSGRVKKVSHGVKGLMRLLLEEGLSTEGFVFDTELAAYLLAPTDAGYPLEKLAVGYLNYELPPEKTFTDPEAFQPLLDSAAAELAFQTHTAAVAVLQSVLEPRLQELGLERLYREVELPLCGVLAEMEVAGVRVDRAALTEFGTLLAEGIDRAREAVYDLAGGAFNINSTQQLGKVLFEDLGLPSVKKTKRGYATNADVLEKLRPYHPIIDRVLEYRQLTKLKSTYTDGLAKVIGPDQRIHTSFQNTVTATGRLSSAEPNLQNIPVRTPLGAQLRRMFVAGEGNVLVDADYSQIELRLLAHIAGDEVMAQGFRDGADIHTITASQVFGVPPEQVTTQMRSSAKAVNFGIVYGISEFSLAGDIGVTRAQARAYMDRYFEKYAGVRRYMDQIVQKAREDGYVITLMGRRRWMPELKSSNYNLRSFGERVALNMPIQGTAADIIKLAMVHVQRRLKEEGFTGRLVLQVHDELIVECPRAEGERVAALMEAEMEHVVELTVPLIAEAHVGGSWADAH